MKKDAQQKEKNSPWRLAWKRFRRNRLALAGLIFLVLCALMAIFAYPLMPDNTENANFQILEMAKQPPGTKVSLLLKPRPSTGEPRSWFGSVFMGQADRFEPIVVQENSVKVEGEKLYWQDIFGEDQESWLITFLRPLGTSNRFAKIALEESGKPYQIKGKTLTWQDLEGNTQNSDLTELQNEARKSVETRTFWLGTDSYGRDVLSRLILGARVSLSVGLLAVFLSLLLGITLGSVAGYFGKWVDSAVMWFVSVIWSVPTLLLAIALSFALGKGFWQVFVAIGLSMWVSVARIVRGQLFSIREKEFIEATTALGYRSPRVIFRHILPNVVSPVIIVAAANFASAILIEAGLSFLGIGVQAPMPSWGAMIYEGYTYIVFESGKWLAIFPGLAIILVVISLNLVGFGLRDALDPKYDHQSA